MAGTKALIGTGVPFNHIMEHIAMLFLKDRYGRDRQIECTGMLRVFRTAGKTQTAVGVLAIDDDYAREAALGSASSEADTPTEQRQDAFYNGKVLGVGPDEIVDATNLRVTLRGVRHGKEVLVEGDFLDYLAGQKPVWA